MKIVQTLWCGKKNLLTDPFGWPHAENHLASWALSCHSLREHYDDVVLYTDAEGKRVLSDVLQLPYTDVRVVYVPDECRPHHWAYPKVKTYAMQREPFLHIDGDVYLPHPIPEPAASAPLIVQNREHGAGYYQVMLDRMMAHQGIWLPSFLEEGLRNNSISSFNMGIFGGNDLAFIGRYCEEVFRFFEQNRMNDPDSPYSHITCNQIFEQVFFAVMADKEERRVDSVLGRTLFSENYSQKEFCDLTHYEQHPFFHILGGHKWNKSISELVMLTLLRKWPDTCQRLWRLFPQQHLRLQNRRKTRIPDLTPQECLARYADFLYQAESEWGQLEPEQLLVWEKSAARFYEFLNTPIEQRAAYQLQPHPESRVFTLPTTWHRIGTELVLTRTQGEKLGSACQIAVIPSTGCPATKEIALDDIAANILYLLQDTTDYAQLTERLMPCFSPKLRKDKEKLQMCVEHELEYLLFHGILFAISKNKS